MRATNTKAATGGTVTAYRNQSAERRIGLTARSLSHANPPPPQKITNRPLLTTPTRRCPSCGAEYRHPWGWLALWPSLTVIDLCPRCARVLRYGTEAEREQFAQEIAAHFGEEGGHND